MTLLVIDASAAASWALPHQRTSSAEALLPRLGDFELEAPYLFPAEIRNVLLVSERRRNGDPADTLRALTLLSRLEIRVAATPDANGQDAILDLARHEGLTFYDAVYLDHALRRQAQIASRDGDLLAAAGRQGVAAMDLRP